MHAKSVSPCQNQRPKCRVFRFFGRPFSQKAGIPKSRAVPHDRLCVLLITENEYLDHSTWTICKGLLRGPGTSKSFILTTRSLVHDLLSRLAKLPQPLLAIGHGRKNSRRLSLRADSEGKIDLSPI